MKILPAAVALVLLLLAPSLTAQQAARPAVANAVVVQFMVDGIDAVTVNTAVANGAATVGMLLKEGVTADAFYSTSTALRLELPDGLKPWENAASPNVAFHTGTHIFESRNIDDIFLSAKRAGIVSVFAGGSNTYAVFNTATYSYATNDLTDDKVVDRVLEHLEKDKARLLRLHLQNIRANWRGPDVTTDPKSEYVQYFIKAVDVQLARLIDGLKRAGVWDRTYIIFGSDHGMGKSTQSGHPPSEDRSWKAFAAFYGPGIKRGARIPYAEGPDVAVLTNHLLGLPQLQGHLDPKVPKNIGGVTGVLLANVFEGGPADVKHPRYIERYLKSNLPRGDQFVDYRSAMIKFMTE